MANTYTTIQELFTAVAKSIRGKLNTEDTIVADTFPAKIDSIVTLSEGTSDGTAAAENIEVGKIAYVQGAKVTGTLALVSTTQTTVSSATTNNTSDSNFSFEYVNSTKRIFAANTKVVITETYANLASKASLTAAKLASGQTVLGIAGTFSGDGTATAADMISGKIAYVKGSKVTGTITDNKGTTVTKTSIIKNTDQETGGYLVQYVPDSSNTAEIVAIDKDTKLLIPAATLNSLLGLTAAKVASGQTVGNISGTFTSDGTAAAENIESGIIAYSKGSKITGTLAVKTSISESATITDDTENKTINFATTTGTAKAIYSAASPVTVKASYSALATKLGLTAEKMVKGTVVLGITGTADVEAHDIEALIGAAY